VTPWLRDEARSSHHSRGKMPCRMRFRPIFSVTVFVCLPAILFAQNTRANNDAPKQATAIRVQNDAIRLDGRLDDLAWKEAPVITDFTQREPVEGEPATERMEVRFAYDNDAVYIGARMFSQDPSTIQAPLGRRDNLGAQAEHFFVSLDTYLDRRTAYTFGVSASGVVCKGEASSSTERTGNPRHDSRRFTCRGGARRRRWHNPPRGWRVQVAACARSFR